MWVCSACACYTTQMRGESLYILLVMCLKGKHTDTHPKLHNRTLVRILDNEKNLCNRMLRSVAMVTKLRHEDETQGDRHGCWSPWKQYHTHTRRCTDTNCGWVLLFCFILWTLVHHPSNYELNVFTHHHTHTQLSIWIPKLFSEACSGRVPAADVTCG